MTSKTARATAQTQEAVETQAFDNLVELNKDAFKTVDEMTQSVAETFEAFGEETFDFVRRRIGQDLAMPQKLIGCWTPKEAMAIYLDFFQTAQQDYMEEAERIARLGRGIAQATLQTMRIEIAPEATRGKGANGA